MTLSEFQVYFIFGVLVAIISLSFSIANMIRIKDIEATLERLNKLEDESAKQMDLINNLSTRCNILKHMIDIVFMRTESKKED